MASDAEKLHNLGAKPYKDQAVWFLNAYWKTFAEKEAESVWGFVHKHAELDPKSAAGNELDEFQAHRFLEINNTTLTVLQLREHLRSVGVEKTRYIPLIHFLIFRYKVDWHELVNAAQGDNQEEVAMAQRMLAEVQALFHEAKRTAEESAVKEAEAKAAQAELEAAQAELHAQEHAYNSRTADLNHQIETLSGIVQKNKAKAELAQHLAGDPLPLRRAKITNEAAVKKAERATKAAEDARAAAEAALEDAERKLVEAQAYLDEVKAKPGSAGGVLWWIDRELHEAKAYMPSSKGGYKKEK